MANILIVDDNIIIRKFLKTLLMQAGYTIIAEAANGQAAVELYKKHLPDIVLLDITMPIMNGLDALKQIISINPNAKVIMATALEEKNKIFEAMESGAKHYLVKPLDKNKVLEIIKKVLN